MRVKVELDSLEDVKEFTERVSIVTPDVRLIGKDENGNEWDLSAKSLLCSLVVAQNLQDRKHTAHEVDWNTLYCECEEDITYLINKFII